jgi:hypothetical protein
MSFWEDDVADMLTDFGVTVSLNYGSTDEVDITAIFDEKQEIINPQTGEVISASPALTCESADVAAMAVGDTVRVSGVSYYIKAILNDGTGVTILQISEHI